MCWKLTWIDVLFSLDKSFFVIDKMTYLDSTMLFMVSFQLISMSTYAKNKLQMCCVTQHQSRSLQMWKILTNTPSTLTFCLLQKMTSLVWTIHSWQAFNSFVCPLMLRTNNRCVESLNISVMSPNVDYLSITKKSCLDWTIYSW